MVIPLKLRNSLTWIFNLRRAWHACWLMKKKEVDWAVSLRWNSIWSELLRSLFQSKAKPSPWELNIEELLNNGICLKRYQITKHEHDEWSMQNVYALLKTCWNKRVSFVPERSRRISHPHQYANSKLYEILKDFSPRFKINKFCIFYNEARLKASI